MLYYRASNLHGTIPTINLALALAGSSAMRHLYLAATEGYQQVLNRKCGLAVPKIRYRIRKLISDGLRHGFPASETVWQRWGSTNIDHRIVNNIWWLVKIQVVNLVDPRNIFAGRSR
jgi:hypothetical protein